MDTSETYIKMCDCPEIQEGHEWQDGDVAFIAGDDTPFAVCRHCEGCKLDLQNLTPLWLPRQDQLQKMVETETRERLSPFCWLTVLRDFANLVVEFPGHYRPASMEQLLLAFVMKELHDKVWDGQWVQK